MIGMLVDVFLRDHWRLGRIIAFDPISHYHLLLYVSESNYHWLSLNIIEYHHHWTSLNIIIINRMTSEELEVVELTDCYWVLRSKQDVLFEVYSLHKESPLGNPQKSSSHWRKGSRLYPSFRTGSRKITAKICLCGRWLMD